MAINLECIYKVYYIGKLRIMNIFFVNCNASNEITPVAGAA